jgi:hypothetical protein
MGNDMGQHDNKVTLAALAVGAGAVAAHHISKGDKAMADSVVALLTSDTARGVAFGAGGGAAVGLVTRASVVEILGRTFVGGLMAAVAAPWIASDLLHVPTGSAVYPVLCCSIGVLGYQIVAQVLSNPGALPGIGKTLAPMAGQTAVERTEMAAGAQQAPPPAIPPNLTPWPPAPAPRLRGAR